VRRATRLLAVLVLLGAAGACGPVQSTAYLLDAEVQIEAARTAGADKLAPYEWTSANLYIHKAREEVGYSDFETGVEYAGKASKFANEARDKAMAAVKSEGNTGPVISPPATSP
jgi:uncharacterized protein DUF4398